MYTITVQEQDKKKIQIQAKEGQSVFEALSEQGWEVAAPCGGRGSCGKCKVRISPQALLPELDDQEMNLLSVTEQKKGWRLACRVRPAGDVTVELPREEGHAILTIGGDVELMIDPGLTKEFFSLPKPSLEDQRSDEQRLLSSCSGAQSISYPVLSQLAEVLRQDSFQVTATSYQGRITAVEAGNTVNEHYGLAVDVGTTTVVAYLMDLKNGCQIDVQSAMNPQRLAGADVISRVNYCNENSSGSERLRQLICGELDKMAAILCRKHDLSGHQIQHLVIAGNTVMSHLMLGISGKNIAASPYIPAFSQLQHLTGADLGLSFNGNAVVSVLPNVSAYVGSDTVAAILAANMWEQEETALLIDIGTNGEIALRCSDGILACSTAAGPALEGANIRQGMGGVAGAIDTVTFDKKITFSTIYGKGARGLCGSGIVDAVAEMGRTGIMDSMGRLLSVEELVESGNPWHERMCSVDQKPALLVASTEEGAEVDIFLTQRDVREVQLAKAAIAAGVEVLLAEANLSVADVDHVYLSGGFGNYLNQDNACAIGLIPSRLRSKIIAIGNGAGTGAKMALLSRSHLQQAIQVAQVVQYIELSSRLDFQQKFVESMEFSAHRG